MQPKISVIVPIYKAEEYIERCCVSLFEQTLEDIEFIFVDDCSPDNSITKIKEIVKRYPKRVSSVKFLTHTQNQGVSFSRQQGLEAATGEFVIHCDSDDWVDINAYEKAYNIAIEQDAEIVRFGYVTEYPSGAKNYSSYPREDYMTPLEFNIGPLTGSVWGAIISRKLLCDYNIKFPENINWGEDFCVSIAGLVISKKTICLQECFYHYWQNNDSITHTVSEQRCHQLVKVGDHVEKFLLKVGKLKEYEYQLNYLKFQVKASFLMLSDVRNINRWKSLYPESNKYVMSYYYPLYFRLAAFFIIHNMNWLGIFILTLRDIINKYRR